MPLHLGKDKYFFIIYRVTLPVDGNVHKNQVLFSLLPYSGYKQQNTSLVYISCIL